jgi:hypothetical protein
MADGEGFEPVRQGDKTARAKFFRSLFLFFKVKPQARSSGLKTLRV